MMHWFSAGPTVLASFLASTVEFVEALTIVLAVGLTRGWRSALLGTAAGVALLAVVVLALGSSLRAVPLPLLQLVAGVLLLMFGLRWLHKSILRGAGVLALHDEAQAFARAAQASRGQAGAAGAAFDAIAFIATFKAVLLEGMEVAFVVVAFGARDGLLVPAAAGAVLALLLVTALGWTLRGPLAKVPENSLKFSVGIMLSAFGTYWAGEGVGIAWPGHDASIPLLIAVYLASGLALIKACAWLRRRQPVRLALADAAPGKRPGAVTAVAGQLLGLFVEDAWLAAGVAAWVAGAALVGARHALPGPFACLVFTAGMAAMLGASAVRATRASGGSRPVPSGPRGA